MQVTPNTRRITFSTIGIALMITMISAIIPVPIRVVRAPVAQSTFKAHLVQATPAFKAHLIQAMPILYKLDISQNIQPDHAGIDPKEVIFACQKGKDLSAVHCYGPYQIRQAYDVTSLLAEHFTGLGSSITIIDAYGSLTIKKDLQAFDTAWGLPSAKLNIVAPYGQPKTDSSWAPETSLDVEWAHVMAPDAMINLVVAKSSNDADLYDVTKYAVEHNLGDVLSLSFGENEMCADPALRKAEHTIFTKATKQGMTIVVAAGDSGSAQATCDGLSFQEAVSFPADDPLATAVGGTELSANLATGQYIKEASWNESSAFDKATGGGYSTAYPQPSYQSGIVPSKTGRAVPDLSMNASVNGGVVAFVSDESTGHISQAIMGGTSVATPEMAGLLADAVQMAHHRLGTINPALYKLGAGTDYHQLMNDITSGNNVLTASSMAGYPATKGWDAATGWGTPKQIDPFLKALIAAQTAPIPTTSNKTTDQPA